MSFDRLARHYRWMEAVLAGGLLQRCRTRWLPEVQNAKHVLLAGEGNGRMLAACGATLPGACFTVMDRSRSMLERAQCVWERMGGGQNARFQVADLRAWQNDAAPFDLLITNFFFDCFAPAELTRVIGNLDAAATPSARWLVSDFTVPKEGWQRFRARAVLALAYGFFRATTNISARYVTAPDDLLMAAGFILQRRELFNHGLLHADSWVRTARPLEARERLPASAGID